MLSIRSTADLDRALNSPMDPPLRALLTLRRDQLLGHSDLGEVGHWIVVHPFDRLPAIEAEAGFPLFTSPVDPEGEPPIEWIARHGRLLEAAIVTSDDFVLVLFVPDRVETDPALLLPLLALA